MFIAHYFRVHGNPFGSFGARSIYLGILVVRYYAMKGRLNFVGKKLSLLGPAKRIDRALWGANNIHSLGGIFSGIFGLVAYQTFHIGGELAKSIRFLASKSMGIYALHVPPPVLSRAFFRFYFSSLLEKRSPWGCTFAHYRFAVSVVLYGVTIDSLRESLFTACYTMIHSSWRMSLLVLHLAIGDRNRQCP
jgi:hypothetical protein